MLQSEQAIQEFHFKSAGAAQTARALVVFSSPNSTNQLNSTKYAFEGIAEPASQFASIHSTSESGVQI
jgi:hypothetical protein